MKAIVVESYGPPEAAHMAEWPEPVAGVGEVRVDVHAMGVNFPDVLAVAGRYQNLPGLPFVPGKEAAGRVVSVGPGVRQWRPGDRVMVQLECGAFSESVTVAAEHCFAMPPGLPMFQAAALGLTYQTAWFAWFDRARLRPGETVLVTGASGGVGSAAVQLAKAAGCRVLGAVSSDEKAAFVRALGADGVVDTRRGNLRESIRDQVREHNHGEGADVVIESVGGEVFGGCLRALAWSGRLIIVGFAGGEIPVVKANYPLIKHISISGLDWSDYRDRFPERMRDAQAEIFRFWRNGRLVPPVTRVYPLADAALALAAIADRRALGKLVLESACGRAERERAEIALPDPAEGVS